MRKICFTVFLIAAFVCTGCVMGQAKLSPKVEQVVNYNQNGENGKAIEVFKTLNDTEYKEFESYLEKNPEKLPPIYFVIMADQVFKTNKDKAVLWYNIGKMRSMEDVRMCKDKSARGQTQMYALFAPNTINYMQEKTSTKDFDYTIKIMKETMRWGKAHTERVSPIWACYHGIEVFIEPGPPKLLPESEFPKIQKEVEETYEASIEFFKELKNKQ